MSTRRNFARAARTVGKYRGEVGRKVVPRGLRIIGEEIMTDAKASLPGRGVPRDLGTLAASGRVEGPRGDGTVLLSFGDAASPYALIQHENLSYRHELGEPRYLVRAVDRWAPGGSAALAEMRKESRRIANRHRARDERGRFVGTR